MGVWGFGGLGVWGVFLNDFIGRRNVLYMPEWTDLVLQREPESLAAEFGFDLPSSGLFKVV